MYSWAHVSGKVESMSQKREAPMVIQVEPQPLRPAGETGTGTPCAHARIIDDVLTRGGKRTGKVRCLECGVSFDDPYQGMK